MNASNLELVATITSKGEGYTANVFRDKNFMLNGKPSYWFFGDMDNDVDGSSFWHQDPYGQAETSLRHNGKSIDSGIVPGIVLPPELINVTPEIVLGCLAIAEWRGNIESAVVFDTGPRSKLGEGSYALLKQLGAPAMQNGNGGIDRQEVFYRFWPGVPANLNGVIFDLQAS